MPGETVLVIDDSPTILKVVQLVLTKAKFRVETAADGEEGLERVRAASPDIILLDFVMPRMNGYQFCRELASDPAIKDIPVVLMSAKGDQVGERFVKVMGIVDYITKPFSPEAITAVVQHTITKYARRSSDSHPYQGLLPPGGQPVGGLAGKLPGGLDAEHGLTEKAAESARLARQAALDDVRRRIGQALALAAGGLPGTPANGHINAGELGALVGQALEDELLTEILGRAEPAISASGSVPSLRGDLRVVPIAEVLQLLDVQEQSGVLAVHQGQSAVEIYFRKGRVDLATATGVSEEFLLGRFIVESELMTRQDFDAFLESRLPGSKLIGGQLVKQGYITEADLKTALQKQTSSLVYEILRWRFGSFHFTGTRELPPIAVDASLGLDVEAILMEGFRRVDEWHLIEREVDDFDLVFLRNEDAVAQMGRGRLTREELAILELVNGKNTVKDIIRRSRMGSFDVSKMLYRLLSIKLIRRRVLPVAV